MTSCSTNRFVISKSKIQGYLAIYFMLISNQSNFSEIYMTPYRTVIMAGLLCVFLFTAKKGIKTYCTLFFAFLIMYNEIKIIFDVVGPSPDAIERMLECSNLTQCGINCYGRLSHENTLSIVRKADFSVLMRENKRYAKAGVSTKFVEAMSLAVPSICTAVGGTDAFVTDGR